MNKFQKLFSLCLALILALSCLPCALAAEYSDCTIDENAKASLTIWKYDLTSAMKDGVWDANSFTSTSWRESYVEEVLGDAVREGDANGDPDTPLGNGQNANGYALKGVEFTVLRVADIITFTESINDRHPDHNLTMVLYAFDKEASAPLLTAIGLPDGAGRYVNADVMNYEVTEPPVMVEPQEEVEPQAIAQVRNCWYYQADVLNKALADSMASNSTAVKNALEEYIAASEDAIVMDKTDENGKTIRRDLDLGLWLCVETAVPEMVTSTTDPFLVSLPMTTVSGDASSASPEGGHQWNYDVTIYPKNHTGIPSLEKTVREALKDTGKNAGSEDIHDGFAHTATGSGGDTMEFQIITTLPTVTSNATAIQTWNIYDSLEKGLTYNKAAGVRVEIFTDKDCTDKVASWDMDSGKFGVSYSSDDRHMTVDISREGLAEINGTGENVNGAQYANYSNYTMRITYTAAISTDAALVCGENGNCNTVILTWKRTSTDYYDTLVDDCHVFSFGVDLSKVFSDLDGESASEMALYKHVKFKIRNVTDNYWLAARRDEASGIYYVTGHATEEADGTVFYPVTVGEDYGKVVVKGMEADRYEIVELETASGYTLLKDEIVVEIQTAEDSDRPCGIYGTDVLGVLQNDPHYAFDGSFDLRLAGIPQAPLAHVLLTAAATVDGNKVSMLEDGGSANALVPMKVVNNEGFDLPDTGDTGTVLFTVIGVVLMACSAAVIVFGAIRKRSHK